MLFDQKTRGHVFQSCTQLGQIDMADRTKLKQHVLTEEDFLRLEASIRASGKVKLEVSSIPKDSQCSLTVVELNQLLSNANAFYDAMEYADFYKSSHQLEKRGVNWLGYLYGRQALSMTSVISPNQRQTDYILNVALKSIELAPGEAAAYHAMVLLKLLVKQPNQALQWLRLAEMCPNNHKNLHEQVNYKLKWYISQCMQKERKFKSSQFEC
jgi:hypothetical protein